jgi:hypothetical protein
MRVRSNKLYIPTRTGLLAHNCKVKESFKGMYYSIAFNTLSGINKNYIACGKILLDQWWGSGFYINTYNTWTTSRNLSLGDTSCIWTAFIGTLK